MSNDNIKRPVAEEYEQFKKIFDGAFTTEDQLLTKVLNHISQQKGKHVRPVFTLLCAKMCGEINEATHRVAAAYELLHTASLVHDDVVDNTMRRRGLPSVNSLFDNKTAVLVGDYLLTKSMDMLTRTGHPELFRQLSLLGSTLTRGELLQLQHAFSVPTEEEYIEIIRKKTAVLFTICASSAAISVNASGEQQSALEKFADYVGLCFQIKDDIFDYTPSAQIGKPTLNDIREGKITLPLIHTLSKMEKQEVEELLDNINKGNLPDDFLNHTSSLVSCHGGIEYAYLRIGHFKEQALKALDIFPTSDAKNSLAEMLDYVIRRER